MRPTTKGIIFFGFTEIAVGTITLGAVISSLITRNCAKSPNVLIFVIISSLISSSLGIGVLLRAHYFRKLIMFFAGWIILSKILISGGILTLNGQLETSIPAGIKNFVSILYHALIIAYFHHPLIKKEYEP